MDIQSSPLTLYQVISKRVIQGHVINHVRWWSAEHDAKAYMADLVGKDIQITGFEKYRRVAGTMTFQDVVRHEAKAMVDYFRDQVIEKVLQRCLLLHNPGNYVGGREYLQQHSINEPYDIAVRHEWDKLLTLISERYNAIWTLPVAEKKERLSAFIETVVA